MEDDIQLLLDKAFEEAENILLDTNDIYPFALVLNHEGKVRHVGFQGDEEYTPKAGDVIEVVHQYCEEQLEQSLIKAYALIYEVAVEINEGMDASDAFAVDIIHEEDDDIPIYYFPFKFVGDVKLEFGESFAVKRDDHPELDEEEDELG